MKMDDALEKIKEKIRKKFEELSEDESDIPVSEKKARDKETRE